MIYYLRVLLAAFLFTAVLGASVFAVPTPTGKTSEFMRGEHNQIHASLEKLPHASGKVGEAAKELELGVRPHLFREEKFVMPQLGILRDLALGEAAGDLSWVIPLSEELKKQFPQMQSDHKAIVKYADKLFLAAESEGDQGTMVFVKHLKAHVQDEEDIVYPAAMLAGQFIKMKSWTKVD